MYKYDETTILVTDTLRDLYKRMPKILQLCDEKLSDQWLYKRVHNFVVKTEYKYLYWKDHLEITNVDTANNPLHVGDFRLTLKRNPSRIELLLFDMATLKYTYINLTMDDLDFYIPRYPELPYHILRIKSELDNNILDLKYVAHEDEI